MSWKQGRIFTESDVEAILASAHSGAASLDEVLSGPIETTFGDEPVFVIRAKDNMSIPGLRGYVSACIAAGTSSEHLENIDKSIGAFRRWQEANQDKVKLPD